MKNKMMPIIFYPTKVILVDDNKNFLETTAKALSQQHIETITFTDPAEAVKYINDLPRNNPYLDELHQEDNGYLSSTSEVAFNLKALAEKAMEHKGNTVSLVVSDYDMPTIKGDELFALIDNRYIKKIMLTGEADNETAIELLNNSLIDNFIAKDFTGTSERLKGLVFDYQLEYFYSLLSSITDHLFPTSSIQASEAYGNLLKQIIQDYNIVEYYTMSRNGNKLMIDANGNHFWFVTATEEDFEGWHETAELEDAPSEILNVLEDRSKILLLADESEADIEAKDWHNFLHDAQQENVSSDTLYYAVVKA